MNEEKKKIFVTYLILSKVKQVTSKHLAKDDKQSRITLINEEDLDEFLLKNPNLELQSKHVYSIQKNKIEVKIHFFNS